MDPISFPPPGTGPDRRRQVAAVIVAVTGGALSLLGAARPASEGTEPVVPVDTSPVLRLGASAPAQPPVPQGGISPVPLDPLPVADADGLVKMVRAAEQEAARIAGERKAAEERAARERAAAAERRAARQEAAQQQTAAPSSAATPEPPAAAPTGCGIATADIGPVKPWVLQAADFLGCRFGKPPILGVGSRGGGPSDHPNGLALDFMVDTSTGDRLAECTLRNMDALGVKYVIWKQRINHGSGWQQMEDRGSPTQNHYDHVHVSFDPSPGNGRPTAC